MLRRLYIHNFRCLQNFEIKPGDNAALLLIGKNGVGKSTLANALDVFRKLGSGASRTGSLVTKEDFTLGRTNENMRFEVEVLLEGKTYAYGLVLDMPDGFRELRVAEENFSVDGVPIYTRQEAQVTYKQSEFSLDWHSVALPLIAEKRDGSLQLLRDWMRRMHILAPVPQLMGGESHGNPNPLSSSCENFADYMTALLSDSPASYVPIDDFLKELMPDLREFNNEQIATDTRMLRISFGDSGTAFKLNFHQLSDGEKCMFLCAVVLAAQKAHGNLFVFWDEPDNYLALSEIEHFIRLLRQKFRNGSQIWMTSHNEATINCFSHENTLLLRRKNHCAPVEVRPVHELLDSSESTIQKLRLNELD